MYRSLVLYRSIEVERKQAGIIPIAREFKQWEIK